MSICEPKTFFYFAHGWTQISKIAFRVNPLRPAESANIMERDNGLNNLRHPRALLLLPLILTGSAIATLKAAAPPSIEQQFTQTVQPFVKQYCFACHSGPKPAAGFDLRSYTDVAKVVEDHPRWALMRDKLMANEMPPKQMPQPPPEAREQVVHWIQAMRVSEARKNAGDPGPVLARRLSNAEYDYTIRDLTGVDIRPGPRVPRRSREHGRLR